ALPPAVAVGAGRGPGARGEDLRHRWGERGGGRGADGRAPGRTGLRAAGAQPRRGGLLSKADDPLAAIRIFRGRGCHQCNGSGYRGRLGVFEAFPIEAPIRQMIMEVADGGAIRAAAIAAGMKTMFQDGLAKAFLGETTLDEVFRVAL